MFVLSVILSGRESPLVLFFNSRDKADLLTPDSFMEPVCDDYGSSLSAKPSDIIGFMVTDVGKQTKAQGAIALIQAREQQAIQEQAQKRIATFGSASSSGFRV